MLMYSGCYSTRWCNAKYTSPIFTRYPYARLYDIFTFSGDISLISSYECFILRARRLSSKLLKQGYLAERLKSSFRKFYGRYGDLIQQYVVSLSRMLNDILILDQQWLPNQSDFPPISWPWYRLWPSPIMSGFHGAFATGVACQQGTLTLPDTWFRPPFWDLLMLQLLRPNSSNLPCLYSTFHIEYPLVLSRFCLSTLHVKQIIFTLRVNC